MSDPTIPTKLAYCTSFEQQVEWIIRHLERGGRVHDAGLWISGVDRPIRMIGYVKAKLRAEGKLLSTTKEMDKDLLGRDHSMLVWRLSSQRL